MAGNKVIEPLGIPAARRQERLTAEQMRCSTTEQPEAVKTANPIGGHHTIHPENKPGSDGAALPFINGGEIWRHEHT